MSEASLPAQGRTVSEQGAGRGRDRVAGRAGMVAALAMLAAQLVWQVRSPTAGVQSFPELVVAAVARLTPLGMFAFATENFGSLAQNTLFVLVLVGTVLVGGEAGRLAGRLSARWASGAAVGRLVAGTMVAAGLLLVTLVAIVPIANLGFFAADSSRQAEVVGRLSATFALWAIVWATVVPWLAPSSAPPTNPERGQETFGRRAAVGRLAVGAGALALLGTVAVAASRLMRSGTRIDRAASERAAQDIRATAEARASIDAPAAPTSAPMPRLEVGSGERAAAPPPAGDEPAVAQGGAPTDANGAQLFADLDAAGELTPPLTSVADFYHVSKNIADPTVDGEGWTLGLGGMVKTPLEWTYEQLVARAEVRKITTLGCISNELNGDLIGTAEWQGVPLRDLLVEAGVAEGTVDLVFRCADDYEDSIPLAQGMDPDTLVVVGMNGEPLTPDHGYPARMIVPGIFGMKNVKWLGSIEAVDHDFKGYWQTRGWSDPAPYQIWARIDAPGDGAEVTPGPAVAAGVASAGDRGVGRVEVSLDDGERWADATLEPAINAPFTWVRWAFPFDATAGDYELKVRVTDGNGEVASAEEQPPLPDGATGWPGRRFEVRG